MSEHGFTESVVEQAALAWLESIGWAVRQEPKLLLANQPRNAPITRRLLALDESERPKIDPDFEEVTEGEEVERKERLKTKWAQLEAIVGSDKRLKLIAQDIVEHFETRLEAIDGKAIIVCMSRRICVDLHRELVRLRPAWYYEDDDKGAIRS
jgi:type I site-specific restriction-modification system R (restriction) subunit